MIPIIVIDPERRDRTFVARVRMPEREFRTCVVVGCEDHKEALIIAELYFGGDGVTSMGLVGAKLCGPISPFTKAAQMYEEQRHG